MATLALVALFVVHGLIHVLGVVRPAPARRSLAPLWFFAATLFFGAAVLCVVSDVWPLTALIGVLLSQALVITRWREAKSATLVNALIATVAIVAAVTAHRHERASIEARTLVAAAPATERPISEGDVAPLPPPVGRWLRRAGVVGLPPARAVRLSQLGTIHTSPQGSWVPIRAEEDLVATEPGFVWWMEGRVAHAVPLSGSDHFIEGHGATDIAVAGLIPVASAKGMKVDQSALVRWLAEIMWVPSAALSPSVRWDAVDDEHARATVTDHGMTATAQFEIDAEGRVMGVLAERWYPPTNALEWWGGRCWDWRRIRGVEIPVAGEVIWYLQGDDFDFFRWSVIDAVPEPEPPPRVDPAGLGRLVGASLAR